MMDIINIPINEINPYKNNPRKIDNSIDFVKNSIEEFGFVQPLVLDKEYNIVVGHTRFAAAKKLGLKEVPCVIADELSEEDIKAYRLIDNKTRELADWDGIKLVNELEGLSGIEGFDLQSFGFASMSRNEDIDTDEYEEYENNDEEEIYVGGSESGEINLGSFDDDAYEHTCPECGFRFNGGEYTEM